jgi:hypothetical protein
MGQSHTEWAYCYKVKQACHKYINVSFGTWMASSCWGVTRNRYQEYIQGPVHISPDPTDMELYSKQPSSDSKVCKFRKLPT